MGIKKTQSSKSARLDEAILPLMTEEKLQRVIEESERLTQAWIDLVTRRPPRRLKPRHRP